MFCVFHTHTKKNSTQTHFHAYMPILKNNLYNQNVKVQYEKKFSLDQILYT